MKGSLAFTASRRHLVAAGAIAASALITRGAAARRRWWGDGDNDADDRRKDDDDRGQRSHCFLKGTLIRTADGERPVEEIAVGDVMPTMFGGVGRVVRHFDLGPADRAVRITRSALGPGIPFRDLCVSAGHALLIDGMLLAAGNLINDRTILRLPHDEDAEYFHIELQRHDVVWAEAMPCETLLGVGQVACAQLVPYGWARGEITSHLRSALSPVIDRRQTVDIIRDKLEARGIAISRQPELMS